MNLAYQYDAVQFAQPEPREFALKFVATLYGARLKSPSDVWKRIRFKGRPNNSPDAPLFFQLFMIHLQRWLHGQGHPQGLVGTKISQNVYEADDERRHIMRAKLFWKATTDFKALPVEDDAELTVCPHSLFADRVLMHCLM